MPGPARVLVFVACAALAMAQQDEASLQRCRAIAAAQDAGRLDVAAVVAALGDPDDDVARTAAAIVRHEWAELPPALFAALDAAPRAAQALLAELAQAPRPAASAWVAAYALDAPGRGRDARCLALAARGTPLAAAEVDLVLQTLLAGEADDGCRAALAVVAPAAADAQVGRLHAALAQGFCDVDRILPWIDRMSPIGVRRLLGLVVALPEALAVPLCAHVHERAPELVRERVAAALDDAAPLAPVWVAFAGPCLDRPARLARVRAVLADEQVAVAVRDHAALALLAQKICDDVLLDHAERSSPQGALLVRKALDVAIDSVPVRRLVTWLDGDLATAVATALLRRRTLEPELETALLARLADVGVADGTFGRPATQALVAHGSAAALQRLWPALRASPGRADLLDALARRRAPFVHERLLASLQEPADDVPEAERAAWFDALALALVTLGDRRELQRLVAAAATAPAGVVRRCAHHARPLPAPFALQLLAAVPQVADVTVAGEMLAWAATAVADPAVGKGLRALWETPARSLEGEELREVALRALAGSDERPRLAAHLRERLAAGPLPEDLEPLPYALLASMPAPPSADDLSLCADLLLLAPRTDAAREQAAAARWPDGDYGFPLVGAVAERLRAAAPADVAAACAAAVRDALADPRHASIAPSRLLVLWRDLAVVPAVQRAVGTTTAPLAAAVGGASWPGAGPTAWFQLQAATDRGDHAAAAVHARTAIAHLLRLPEARRHARIFLGERDPGAGSDPWAALAAAPHVAAWRAATAAGDAAAAARAAQLVHEFGGHDRTTEATVPVPSPETVR